MFNSLLLRMVRFELARVKLPFQSGEDAAEASQGILDIFARGFEIGLMEGGIPAAEAASEALPWNRRCFFWEGYACGLAGAARMRWRSTHPEALSATGHYRSMSFTGYGMWNGLVGRLSFLSLPTHADAWAQTPDYATYRPLLIGGEVFGRIAFREGLAPGLLTAAWITGDEDVLLGTEHGFGRALWWLYMDNPAGAQAFFEDHPRHAQGIAEGVGLAIGFLNLAQPRRIPELIEAFAPEHRASLLGGVGVCLEAMREEHPEYGPRIASLDVPLLSRAQALAQGINSDVPRGEGWYAGCVARLRRDASGSLT